MEIGYEQAGHSQVNRLFKVYKRDNSSPLLGNTQLHSARAQVGPR